MIRMTISKIRQVCTMAFIPRLLRGDIGNVMGKIEKMSVGKQKRTLKSTKSGSEGETEEEKCQKIIDLAFAPNLPFTETLATELDTNTKGIVQMVSSRLPPNNDKHCDKCKDIIEEIFNNNGTEVDKINKGQINTMKTNQIETLKATTAKVHEEKLVQKIEDIDETPLVEAHKPNTEGFNVVPKVLGNKEKERRNTRDILTQLNCSTSKNDKDSNSAAKTDLPNFDELAKRCLDSSSRHIDERLLKEMEQLGVPPTSGRQSKKRFDENIFSQPEIMKKPRRPIEKSDLDLIAVQNKENMVRYNDEFPPPFEITIGKFIKNNITKSDWTDENDEPIRKIDQLLGHTATTNFTAQDTMKLKNISCKAAQVNPKPNMNFVEHISVIIEEPALQTEHSTAGDSRKSGQSKAALIPDIAKETGTKRNKQILNNLLQTRTEHLIQYETNLGDYARENSNTNLTDTIKDDIVLKPNIAIQAEEQNDIHDKFIKPERVTPPHVLFNTYLVSEEAPSSQQPKDLGLQFLQPSQLTNKGIGELTSGTSVKEVSKPKPTDAASVAKMEEYVKGASDFATSEEADISSTLVKPERVIPIHILYGANVFAKEAISTTQPNVVIREFIEVQTMGTGQTSSKATTKSINAPIKDDLKKEKVQSKTARIKNKPIAMKRRTFKKENLKFTNIEPVIVAETGRLQIKNPHLLSEYNAVIKDQFTKSIVPPAIPKPLLEGTVVDVTKGVFEPPAVKSLNSNNQDAIPLSELLKKVRERNRLEYCREVELKMHCAPQVDPVVGECGKKPICPPEHVCPRVKPKCPPSAPSPAPICPPPAPICPPPKKVQCPPPKSPCPKPCKPKCPPPCNPDPCGPKTQCPSAPPNPCNTSKCKCISIREILALLVYYGPQFHIPQKCVLPLMICTLKMNKFYEIPSENLQNPALLFAAIQKANIGHYTKTNDSVEYSRTYDPWSPIPSWPNEEKYVKSKLVCPKEGCKVAPPRLNPPCSDINPCVNLPKPNSLAKRSFTLIDYILMSFTKTC